jgi:ABC-2 type transport system ATP-binding protein
MSNATEPADPACAIDVRNLTYSFKNKKALDNVQFQVQRGSLHGFVGPNGAGKTTALKTICTLLRPQFGTVKVFGFDVVLSPNDVRRRIGFMPDHFSMYRQMTVYEYLDFFGAAYGLTVKHRDRVIQDVLALTDMDVRKDDLISSLSRGMQQRVSLARVLVNDPELLLLDEPASGLDPRARIELMEILRELQRIGKTIFISSHILSELAELCDSVTIIDRGRVKYSGTMSDLSLGGDMHPGYTLTLAGENEGAQALLARLPGVVDVSRQNGAATFRIAVDDLEAVDANSLLRGVLDLGLPVASFAINRKHLNQAFMDLTEQGVT